MRKFLVLCILSMLIIIGCNKNEKPANDAKSSNIQQNSNSGANPPAVNPDGSVILKLKLQKGDKYEMEMTADQKISQELKGQKQNMNQKISFVYSYNVLDKDNQGNMTTKITYSSIFQEIDAGMGKVQFDSKNPPKVENPQTQVLNSLVNKSFTVKQSPTGKVLEMKGIEEILKSMLDKLDIKNEEQKKMVYTSLSEQFGTRKLSDMYEKTMNFYDETPKKVGDKWTKEYPIDAGFGIVISTNYTLKEIKGNVVNLELDSKISTDLKSKPGSMSGVMMKYNLKGTQNGTMEVDASTGMIIKANVYQKLGGTVSTEKSETMKEAISIPMSIETVNIVKTTKK